MLLLFLLIIEFLQISDFFFYNRVNMIILGLHAPVQNMTPRKPILSPLMYLSHLWMLRIPSERYRTHPVYIFLFVQAQGFLRNLEVNFRNKCATKNNSKPLILQVWARLGCFPHLTQ